MPDSAPTHLYFEALRKSYDILVAATEKSTKRGTIVSAQVTAEIQRGQREAIALTEKLTAVPANAAENYTALLEAALSAQERSLALAKDFYAQAEGAGADVRTAFEDLVASGRAVGEAAIQLSRNWMSGGAWSEVWKQGVEAMSSAASAAASKQSVEATVSAASAAAPKQSVEAMSSEASAAASKPVAVPAKS